MNNELCVASNMVWVLCYCYKLGMIIFAYSALPGQTIYVLALVFCIEVGSVEMFLLPGL
jgi:hypothetical protein